MPSAGGRGSGGVAGIRRDACGTAWDLRVCPETLSSIMQRAARPDGELLPGKAPAPQLTEGVVLRAPLRGQREPEIVGKFLDGSLRLPGWGRTSKISGAAPKMALERQTRQTSSRGCREPETDDKGA